VNTPLRRSGIARVLKGSHSFTCTPRVHLLSEWTIPAFAFPAEAGTHLLTPEGCKAELVLCVNVSGGCESHYISVKQNLKNEVTVVVPERSARYHVVADQILQDYFWRFICGEFKQPKLVTGLDTNVVITAALTNPLTIATWGHRTLASCLIYARAFIEYVCGCVLFQDVTVREIHGR